jgi:hypothetical protein
MPSSDPSVRAKNLRFWQFRFQGRRQQRVCTQTCCRIDLCTTALVARSVFRFRESIEHLTCLRYVRSSFESGPKVEVVEVVCEVDRLEARLE